MRQGLAGAFAILALAAESWAYAHHSHPYFYDACKPITIEGRVDSVDFKDPHTWIVVRTDAGAVYTVDWGGMRGLTNQRIIGPAKEALIPGARVVVTGNRIRPSAEIRGFFPDFKSDVNPNTLDPMSIRTVGNGFTWGRPPLTNPPNCAGQ